MERLYGKEINSLEMLSKIVREILCEGPTDDAEHQTFQGNTKVECFWNSHTWLYGITNSLPYVFDKMWAEPELIFFCRRGNNSSSPRIDG